MVFNKMKTPLVGNMLDISAFLFVVIVMLNCTYPTSGQHISDVKRLIKDKEINYDKSVRPVTNQSIPVKVYLSFDMLALQEVNEVEQTITVSALIAMHWMDEQMAWDPKDYGGVGKFTIDNDRFWTPTIVLTNTNDKLEAVGDSWLSVYYASSGFARYYPGTISKVMCALDIRFYPWDRHACYLLFSPWGSSPSEYMLYNRTDKVGTSYYFPNGAWTFTGSNIQSVHVPGLISGYFVGLFIERQPAYVLVNVILPVIILSLLNLMIYFIPTESGERLSFSITLLLAIAVFLTIVADNLPKSSKRMAILSFYLLAVLVISNCVTLSIIYSLCLYHRDESEPVGGCWKRIVRVMKCQCASRKRSLKYRHGKHKVISNVDKVSDNGSNPHRDLDSSMHANPLDHNILFHAQTHLNLRNTSVWPPNNDVPANGSHKSGVTENEDEQHENDKESPIAWKDVSIAFDRICFVFFVLVLIVAKCITCIMIYNGLKQLDDTTNT